MKHPFTFPACVIQAYVYIKTYIRTYTSLILHTITCICIYSTIYSLYVSYSPIILCTYQYIYECFVCGVMECMVLSRHINSILISAISPVIFHVQSHPMTKLKTPHFRGTGYSCTFVCLLKLYVG